MGAGSNPAIGTAEVLIQTFLVQKKYRSRIGRMVVCDLPDLRLSPRGNQSKVQHLLAESIVPQEDYNRDVRYYTTKPLNGGITFQCTVCEFTVHTLDFDHTKGNRRTQAAAAVNQHVRELHPPRLRLDVPVRPVGRGY